MTILYIYFILFYPDWQIVKKNAQNLTSIDYGLRQINVFQLKHFLNMYKIQNACK